CPLSGRGGNRRAQTEKSLFASFSSEKEGAFYRIFLKAHNTSESMMTSDRRSHHALAACCFANSRRGSGGCCLDPPLDFRLVQDADGLEQLHDVHHCSMHDRID